MNGFFLDVMGAPEINWGTNPIKIRTKTKVFQHGYYTEGEVIDETFMDVSSPQMLSEEEIKNKGKDLKGNILSQGTTPRRLTDLIGSLCDLTSGSGDKGTPVVFIQGYFDNLSDE